MSLFQRQGSSASVGSLDLGLGLAESLGECDVFGGGGSGSGSQASQAGESQASPSRQASQAPSRQTSEPDATSKAAAKAKGKAKAKQRSKSKMCPCCKMETTDWAKRPVCRVCQSDWESSERDAKTQGQHDSWKISDNLTEMCEFLVTWKREVGPSLGPGRRRGGFKFLEYSKKRQFEMSRFDGQDLVMKTELEFVDLFEKKGMTKVWGHAEFARRRADPRRWASDNDPDCKLPRVQAHGETRTTTGQTDRTIDEVKGMTEQLKKPDANAFKQIMKGFGEDLTLEKTVEAFTTKDESMLWVDFQPVASSISGPSGASPPKPQFGPKSFLSGKGKDTDEEADEEEQNFEDTTDKKRKAEEPGQPELETPNKKGKKDKVFDADISLTDAKVDAHKSFVGIHTSLTEALNDGYACALEAKDMAQKHPAIFAARHEVLFVRCDCLAACLGANRDWDEFKATTAIPMLFHSRQYNIFVYTFLYIDVSLIAVLGHATLCCIRLNM